MKSIIGITMGDPAGIGPEIAIKALAKEHIYEKCIPVIIGDAEPLKDANRFTSLNLKMNEISGINQAKGEFGTVDYLNLNLLSPGSWEYKKVSALAGKAAFNYVKKGIELALENKIHAVVTGPINKESINLAGYHYSGHTEIFADLTGTKDYAMMLASSSLKVVHVTTHVSMRKACDLITEERVFKVINLANDAMKMMGVENPRIAVAGLNAHSSENGLFGNEEATAIKPAIDRARQQGINADGPVPPDTVFVKALAGQYDIVVAMYHDQGHIPVKLTGFKLDLATKKYTSVSGINCTLGLPIIRTSVDHGTAFGKAGEGRANEESLVDAIEMAIRMAKVKFDLK
ncbi:MAG: 4-phospho-D-threonate 3-dehydrogenase / 4-phospho-D-erythronate 3-dehydrogenase [Thermoanaerobacteraceae bacterium]|nr:4-phospho-D-threonate 3-dehydrogenase / 4-phospho-D-erythronate 3-dehydrogenase [Thermoanaerobacteraceae bacterium]